MTVISVLAPHLILTASTVEQSTDTTSLFKIAFRGFEDRDHWVGATKSSPDLVAAHGYSQIDLRLDGSNEHIWILNQDLTARFTKTPPEIETVLQHFPYLLSAQLHAAVRCCTSDLLSEQEVDQMIEMGNRHLHEPTLTCIRNKTARTLISGQEHSFILFTKCQKKQDRRVGSGSIKQVKLALKIQSAKIYAVAVCRFEWLDEIEWKLITNEVNLLNELRGRPGIVQVVAALDNRDKFYILTEFYNCGDLQRIFDSRRPFAFEEKLQIAKGLALGLSNLHFRKIVHRDLKPSNIFVELLEGRYSSVIGDLGSACKLGQQEFIRNRTGTAAYIAPEKLASFWDKTRTSDWVRYSTCEADIWSLGLILFSLFHPDTGSLMEFQKAKKIEESIKGLKQEEIAREIESSGIDMAIRPLLHKMLCIKFSKRCSAAWLDTALGQIRPPEAGALEA